MIEPSVATLEREDDKLRHEAERARAEVNEARQATGAALVTCKEMKK